MEDVEQARQYHEQIEYMELLIAQMYQQPLDKHKKRLAIERFVAELLDRIQSHSHKLCLFYQQDAVFNSNISDISEFYTKLRHIKEVHKNNPMEAALPFQCEMENVLI